jgi:hypothetical protein
MQLKYLTSWGGRFLGRGGSHIVMTKEGSIYSLSIPNKNTLAPGLLRNLISKADLTVNEFTDLL